MGQIVLFEKKWSRKVCFNCGRNNSENTVQDTFLSRIGNSKLGLSSLADANLTATSNTTGLVVAGKTNPNYQLLLGLTGNYGSIQSIERGTGYTPLVINPSGRYISVNTSLPSLTSSILIFFVSTFI